MNKEVQTAVGIQETTLVSSAQRNVIQHQSEANSEISHLRIADDRPTDPVIGVVSVTVCHGSDSRG